MPLNEAHWNTLATVADRIVPRDDRPSATEAGVLEFLRRLLPAEGLELRYAAGLAGIEAESHASYGLPFDALSAEWQDELLTAVQAGHAKTQWATEPALFFSLLAAQVIEGYYADPENGGNRDGVAWEMVGFRVNG